MKKFLLCFIILTIFSISSVYAEENLIPGATSGVLMEESTGKLIFEKDKDKQVPVASMTKMVAQIIILDSIDAKKIKWDDVVTISKNAADMGGSQIYLSEAEKMTVRDLMKGISMASANDATVAMAEYISGSEEKFVKKMNKKVEDLGLKNTHFANSTGLDQDKHYSSAYDMALIARELLRYEDILKFSSVYEDYLRVDTPNKFWLVNTNKLVRLYNGADGLKTGHTDNAGYCLAATAVRNNMRLIGVVLGEESAKVRNSEAMELLDYGFNTKSVQSIKKKTDVIKNVKLNGASKANIKIYPEYDINILQDKNDSKIKYRIDTNINNLELPLSKNVKVGVIEIINKKNKKSLYKGNLVVHDDVYKLKFHEVLFNNIMGLISGEI